MLNTGGMGLSEGTLREYNGVLKVAFRDGEIDVSRVKKWSKSRRIVLKAAMRNAGVDKAEILGMMPEEPRGHHRKDLEIPAETEIERLKEVLRKDGGERGIRPGARHLMQLILQMGFRSQEVLQLNRRNVMRAVDVGEIVFLRKGDYTARLPAKNAKRVLESLLNTPSGRGKAWKIAGEVLCWDGGPHTQYQLLRRACRRAGRMAGITGLRPHLLRHAFATQMVRNGTPIAIVQKWLGHKNLATTQRYVHPDFIDMSKWALKNDED